jgi:hypothetical protein
MRNLKNIIAAITMMTVLVFATSAANAGIIVAGFGERTKTATTEPCTERTGKPDWGIIVAGLRGIIVAGLTGIIVAGATETPTTECGIIVAG